MPSGKALIFEIIGIDHASKAFKSVQKEVDKTSGGINKLKAGAVAGFAIAAGAAIVFAKKSVDAFQDTGKAAIALQRVMGGTAEQASRLNFAAEEKGIQSAQLITGIRLLSKHLVANDKAWQGVGIAARDANGKLKPTADLLPQIADKFASMPNGAQKTALALQLFGRSGTNLLPLLNLGSKGLEEFNSESDKLGHTLSGPQLDAIKKVTMAHRQFDAAIKGVEIQVGAALYPALVKIIPAVSAFASSFAQKAIPVVKQFGAWMTGKLFPALAQAWHTILPGLTNAFNTVTKALGNGKVGWSGVGDKILSFIKVASQVINVVLPAMARLWANNITAIRLAAKYIEVYGQIGSTVFRFVANVFLTTVGVIVNGAARAFGWIPGLGGKLKSAAAKFNSFRNEVNAALNGIKKTIDVSVNVHFNQVGVSNKLHAIAGQRASGGPVRAGSTYLVGENGPELFTPASSGKIVANGQTKAAMAAGGNTINITVNGALDPRAVARQIQTLLLQQRQALGGNLGIA